MPSKNGRSFTTRSIDAIKEPGRVNVGERLYLETTKSLTKLWVYSYPKPTTGRMTETGLIGHYPAVSLASAREKARAFTAMIADGLDPIEQRREARLAAQKDATTFRTAFDQYAAAFAGRPGTAQLVVKLERHAQGLMSIPIAAVDTQQVVAALHKVQASAPTTARTVLSEVARILDYARVAGMIPFDRRNPAEWKGSFDKLWSDRLKTVHVRSIGYEAVPALWERLAGLTSTASHCLRFLILTGVRTSCALYATWDEIDMSTRTWTIPASRMKMGREFVIALPDEALKILGAMRQRWPSSDLIFPSDAHGGRQHPRSLQYQLQGVLGIEASVHGFRSCLSTWAHDETNFEHETIEAALAHATGSTVSRAYNRGTQLEKRKLLMLAWERHVTGDAIDDVVLPFVGAARS
jgi:integrase